VTGWAPEKAEEARRMWLEGKSAGIIAKALGTSRSAVAGKMARLRLRRAPNVPRASLEPPPRKAKPRPASGEPPWVSLFGLEQGMCRYPHGERPVEYCGAAASEGSWCAAHRRIVFISPADGAPARAPRASCSPA